MKKILLINLRRLGDIYSMAPIISSLKEKYQARIDLLIYNESKVAAGNLSEISSIYSIDRKSIITQKNNPVFQNGSALNQFSKTISYLEKTNWDHVINISNDPVAAHLTSYLTNFSQKTESHGIKFSESNTVVASNDWAIVLNDILPCFNNTPFHFKECYHRMLDLQPSNNSTKLKIDFQHEQTTKKYFDQIRTDQNFANTEIKIVGLQLKTSTQLKDIPFDTTVELINQMLDTPDYYPVLLTSPSDEEKNYANQINGYFDNRLIIIECDLCALRSVVSQLDLLITPDTVTKHIADLSNIPLIEVSIGSSPFLKQGTANPNSLILTNSLQYRRWKAKEAPQQKNYITAKDILTCIKIIFQPALCKHAALSQNVTLYKAFCDKQEIVYRAILGHISRREEFSRQFAREYLLSQLSEHHFVAPKSPISCYQTAKDWIQSEKNAIAGTSKKLLKTLRELIQIKDTSKTPKASFVTALDDLLSDCESQRLASLPLLFFRARLESLPKSTFKTSSTQIEALLYQLKEELQMLLNCSKEFESSLTRKTHRPAPAMEAR